MKVGLVNIDFSIFERFLDDSSFWPVLESL